LRALLQILRQTPFGTSLAEFVESEAADLALALDEDYEVFGLAARTLSPLLRLPTNLDLLDAVLDDDTVQNAVKLLNRLSKVSPRLRPKLERLRVAFSGAGGLAVREVLREGSKRTTSRK
jgi:hypothetical protein